MIDGLDRRMLDVAPMVVKVRVGEMITAVPKAMLANTIVSKKIVKYGGGGRSTTHRCAASLAPVGLIAVQMSGLTATLWMCGGYLGRRQWQLSALHGAAGAAHA